MAVHRAQAHIDASIESVWQLVGDPSTYPGWWPVAVEIRGERFEAGDAYTQVARIAGMRLAYRRVVERREELRELSWRCPTTGTYQRWLLTEAAGGTFIDMEMGMEPATIRHRAFEGTVGRIFVRRWAEQALEGLERTLGEPERLSRPRT